MNRKLCTIIVCAISIYLSGVATGQESSNAILDRHEDQFKKIDEEFEKFSKEFEQLEKQFEENSKKFEEAQRAFDRGEISQKEYAEAIEKERESIQEYFEAAKKHEELSTARKKATEELERLRKSEGGAINSKPSADPVTRGITTAVPENISKGFISKPNSPRCRFIVQKVLRNKHYDSLSKEKIVTSLKYGHMKLLSEFGLFSTGNAQAYNGEYSFQSNGLNVISNTLMVLFDKPRPVETSVEYRITHVVTDNHNCKGKGSVTGVLRPQFTVDYAVAEPDVFFSTSYYMRFRSSSRDIKLKFDADQEFGKGVNITGGLSVASGNAGAMGSTSIPIHPAATTRPQNRVFSEDGEQFFSESGDEISLYFYTGWSHMKIGATTYSTVVSLGKLAKVIADFGYWVLDLEEEPRKKWIVENIVSGSDTAHIKVEIKEPDWNFRLDAHCSNSANHRSPKIHSIENRSTHLSKTQAGEGITLSSPK